MSSALPVADTAEVRRYAITLMTARRGPLVSVLSLTALATIATLVGPWVVGSVVDIVISQPPNATTQITRLLVLLTASILGAGLLTRWSRYRGAQLAEQVLAELRETFIARLLDLPLGTVERAGTGDLLTRSGRDVDSLRQSVRRAAPEIVTGLVGAVLTVVAMVIAGPLVALPYLVAVPPLVLVTRWYLRRSREGYLREMSAWSQLNAGLGQTVDGARDIETLGLQQRRMDHTDTDIARQWVMERYTLRLRSVYFPVVEVSYTLPLVAILAVGSWLVGNGHAQLGEVTTVSLYALALTDPLDRLMSWLDELQVGGASLARLLGVGQVPTERGTTKARPDGTLLQLTDVRFSYRDASANSDSAGDDSAGDDPAADNSAGDNSADDNDVLHGVSLTVKPGERLAMVGPSGAGKSTLGRLVAGVHPPRTGSVSIGGVEITELPLDVQRREVALVTQEHHVFAGTIADNLRLAAAGASEDALQKAMDAVGAGGWLAVLPEGLNTAVGAGGHTLSPAQAQLLALARVVLADPHTLVLDEATSLLDPTAGRNSERALSAVLSGRTVVAIAHRLSTAHDADRIAVVDGGRIVELGSHDELLRAGGTYAGLWRHWHG